MAKYLGRNEKRKALALPWCNSSCRGYGVLQIMLLISYLCVCVCVSHWCSGCSQSIWSDSALHHHTHTHTHTQTQTHLAGGSGHRGFATAEPDGSPSPSHKRRRSYPCTSHNSTPGWVTMGTDSPASSHTHTDKHTPFVACSPAAQTRPPGLVLWPSLFTWS